MFAGGREPIIIEIIDESEKIEAFVATVQKLINESEKVALVTLQDIEVLEYKRGKNYNQFTNF